MYKLKTRHRKLLADTHTPVSIYLQLRDRFPGSLLLESSDYHGNENSVSYICCSPMAFIRVAGEVITERFPDGTGTETPAEGNRGVTEHIAAFAGKFSAEATNARVTGNGLFGYMSYDAVRYFEDIRLSSHQDAERAIPDIFYGIYRYVIAINHFNNELYVFGHSLEGEHDGDPESVITLIRNKNFSTYGFGLLGEEESSISDEDFLRIVTKGKEHCHRGDVFQLVLSRAFARRFSGDEFNVYRALRSINPSPYLFYFDYGDFRLFGSSPEAQIVIRDGKASIFPIAGTFRRTGDDKADAALAAKLLEDPKENSEHVMLVDLARNDLSRNSGDVLVDTFREVQYYSHVIHLVSKVTGTLKEGTDALQVVADTFPAGTLSGAPKHMAMQLIDRYERGRRGFYGGCIGYLGFNGDFNHAIMIRSFLSKGNKLFYQAGAGIVENSSEASELNEVANKLMALRNAMELAKNV